MLKNFENIKKQLQELSSVINSFKSESVQLRIVELVFGVELFDDPPAANPPAGIKPKSAKSRRRRSTTVPKSPAGDGAPKKKRIGTGAGAVSTLLELYESGFFKTAKTIGEITSHSEVHKAKKIRPNEISGKLGRMVRTGELKRQRNSDGQYEYTKP